MTKDKRLAIIHGGTDGEMPVPLDQLDNPEYAKQYVFNMTFDEIQ